MKIHTSIVLTILLVALIFSLQLMTPSAAFAIPCSTESECSRPYFYGGQYCNSNKLYQNQIKYSCINSQCVSRQEPYLIQTCPDQCVEGLWFTGCSTGGGSTSGTGTGAGTGTASTGSSGGQCYPSSYQKCVGNNVYWFDSCNVQGALAKACPLDQACLSGACTTNYTVYPNPIYNYNTTNNITNVYSNHFSKGCENNIVYWYDTLGNKGDVYQNCNYSGQLCSDGKCVADPSPAPRPVIAPATPTPALAPAPKPTPTPTPEPEAQNPDLDSSTAAVSGAKNSNSFMEFLKKWYVWIIVTIILIIFFIIVFKKSSAEAERKRKKEA